MSRTRSGLLGPYKRYKTNKKLAITSGEIRCLLSLERRPSSNRIQVSSFTQKMNFCGMYGSPLIPARELVWGYYKVERPHESPYVPSMKGVAFDSNIFLPFSLTLTRSSLTLSMLTCYMLKYPLEVFTC